MKYLFQEDKFQQDHVILDRIAEFLWDKGNEIYSSNNIDRRTDYINVAKSCDCIISVIFEDCMIESIFGKEQKPFQAIGRMETILKNKILIAFTMSGVYCNTIPYPHKIFHFEGLCHHELTRFFHWCEELSLFVK